MESTAPPIAKFDGIAIPVAFIATGIGMLVWSVIGTDSIVQGLPLTLFSLALFIAAMVRYRPHLAWLIISHVLTAGFLILGATHLCASRCGQFPYYDTLIIIPTSVAGILLHVGLAGLGILSFRIKIPSWMYCLGLSLAAGATIFYVLLMLTHQHWCAACAAAHALVVVQVIQAYRLLTQAHLRVIYGLTALVWLGAINAIYHHHAYATVHNDPADLLAWLQGQERSANIPVGIIQPRDARSIEATSGAQIRKPLSGGESATSEAGHATAPGASTTTSPGGRDQLLGVWGDPHRVIKLVANLDPTCPYCGKAFDWIRECEDLILGQKDAHGQIKAPVMSVDFELTYKRGPNGSKDVAGELGCYLIYASSYLGDEAMIAVMHALMSDPGRAAMRDAGNAMTDGKNKQAQNKALAQLFELLPGKIDKTVLQHYLEQHRSDIENKIKNTYTRMAEFGVADAPNLWLFRTDKPSTEPIALFRGAKEPDVLRYAVAQGLKEAP